MCGVNNEELFDYLRTGFICGYITKDEYAFTLRKYQEAYDEMKSDAREKAKAMNAARLSESSTTSAASGDTYKKRKRCAYCAECKVCLKNVQHGVSAVVQQKQPAVLSINDVVLILVVLVCGVVYDNLGVASLFLILWVVFG